MNIESEIRFFGGPADGSVVVADPARVPGAAAGGILIPAGYNGRGYYRLRETAPGSWRFEWVEPGIGRTGGGGN